MWHTISSAVCFVLFFGAFQWIVNRAPVVSFGLFDRLLYLSLFIFPVIGIVLAIKGRKGVWKWLSLLANGGALLFMGYILLLANGIGEA